MYNSYMYRWCTFYLKKKTLFLNINIRVLYRVPVHLDSYNMYMCARREPVEV